MRTVINNNFKNSLDSLLILTGSLLILLSMLVIIGWLLSSEPLVRIQPQFATMKFNTALGFLLCGCSFILLCFKQKIAIRCLSAFLVSLATLSLLQWIFNRDLGIDNFFIVDQMNDPSSPPGRMSIPTALCFLLSAVALYLTTLRQTNQRKMIGISIIGAIVLAIGLIGLIDYALSVFSVHGWQQYTVMAVHTTTGFCAIGALFIIITVLNRKAESFDFIIYGVPVATVLMMLCLSISIAIDNKSLQYNHSMLNQRLDTQVEQIKQDISFILNTVNREAKRWALQKGEAHTEWQVDSELLLDSTPFLNLLNVFDASLSPVWLVNRQDNISLNDLHALAPKLLKASRMTAEMNYINTDKSKQTFFITVPLYINQKFDGFMVGMVDLLALLEKTDHIGDNAFSWLSSSVKEEIIYQSVEQPDNTAKDNYISRDVAIKNLLFKFDAGFISNAPVSGISLLSVIVFISGSMFICMLLAAIYAFQKSRRMMSILSREKEQFRLVVEAAPGAMILTSANGIIELLNTKTELLFGYNHNTLLGQSIDILVPSSHRREHKGLREGYMQNPHLRAMGKGQDLFGLHKNGHLIPVEIELCPIKTERENKVLASVFDLTERTKQLQALTRSKQELDRAGRLAKIGAWHLELLTKEVHWSAQTYKIHEVPESTPLNIEFALQFFSESERKVLTQKIENAILQGAEWDLEMPLTTFLGNKIWVRSQGQVEYENDQPVRAVGAIQDITEKNHIILELERRNQELNNFAYVASHDLKSPLRGIDQLATWLAEDLAKSLDGQTKEHLRLIRSRINRMENLLDDLLAYARAGRTDTNEECIDIVSLLKQVFDFCNTNNTFSLTISGDSGHYLLAKTPLETVLRNLISNAIKHHDQAHGSLSVSIHSKKSRLHFMIADDGPGISPELRERAFAMFQTLQPRDKVEGSGMGLAIVRKMIESFDGQIELRGNEPHGAIFEFSWPAKPMMQ